MSLTKLLELKHQFKEEDVTPLVIKYLTKLEELKHAPYEDKLKHYISLCSVKSDLIKNKIYK